MRILHATNHRSRLYRPIALALMVACATVVSRAQDLSDQSLGDLARKTRKEQSAPGHIAGKELVSEEEDGPDITAVWRIQLCSRTPCYELSVTLPKDPKWTRGKDEPRPVLIPLPGPSPDPNRFIRIYAAESLGPLYSSLDGAKRVFLQGWFARPEYFGQSARIALDEHVQIDGDRGLVSHFSVLSGSAKYRGLSVVAATANGNYGFACAFREEDASTASSVCDAIVKSAHSHALEPGKRPVYPGYQGPPAYYPQGYDPPEDQADDANRE